MAIEIFHNSLQPLIQFLNAHPHSAGLIAFFVVFCEALAVVGVIVPGTVTMTAIGILIGSGVIPAFSTFMWAIAGAITGDYLSYLIGVYYKNRLHRMWPFKRWPKLLLNGEKFFKAHGGKSVIIGRFIGPMRAMIPTIAGMLKMPTRQFLLAAIPSASIWAVLYILPGVLLGALALQLPAKVATQFLLWVMLVVIVVSTTIWLAQHFLKRICKFFDLYIMKLWKFLQKNRYLSWLTNFIADPHRPDNHAQLTLLIAAISTALLFVIILISVIKQGPLTSLNQPLYYLLHSIRTDVADKIMLIITLVVDKNAIFIAMSIFIFWLAYKRYWYIMVHALAILLLTYCSIEGVKILAHVPRPNGLSIAEKHFSFPSGHVTTSVAIYGFLAMIISRDLKANLRWLPYSIVGTIVLLVAMSRLYLGAHWLTDVLGAIFLGLSLLFLITISYHKRHSPKKLNYIRVIALIIFIFVGTLFFNGVKIFHDQLSVYRLQQNLIQAINARDWKLQTEKSIAAIPLYRNNRLGHPVGAFNLQWAGDLADIESGLRQQGWQSYPSHITAKEIFRRLTIPTNGHRVPILSQLYNNHVEALLMTKKSGTDKPMLILRLWESSIEISDLAKPLWLGTVDYYMPAKKLISLKKHKPKNLQFVGAVTELKKDLKNFSWREIICPSAKQPPEMRSLDWSGEVLLIEPK